MIKIKIKIIPKKNKAKNFHEISQKFFVISRGKIFLFFYFFILSDRSKFFLSSNLIFEFASASASDFHFADAKSL